MQCDTSRKWVTAASPTANRFARRALLRNSCPAPFAKTFSFSLDANHFISAAISSHQEGRLAIVTDAGRDAMDADVPLTNGT